MKIIESMPNEDFYNYKEIEEINIVRKILADVKCDGDKAVLKYTRKFDKINLNKIEVTKKEIKEAYKKAGKETVFFLKKAAKRIEFFSRKQFSGIKEFKIINSEGIFGQKIIPITRAGCYVPGGKFPLPSSALMGIIPAKVAGVKEIIVCSPKIAPATIVACDIAGANRIFKIGGAQAIGAMAYGTKTVPAVDIIVGPGNKYVAAAKKEVYGIVGIDFIAGPSEVMIIADETANSNIVAADLCAQAEHDIFAQAILITNSRKLAKIVKNKVKIENGVIIIANLDDAIEIANKKAPEHLELQINNPRRIINKLKNYGSLFIGEKSAEVFGDYCAGPNHILPTNGSARYTGGLSVLDFLKFVTYQKVNKPKDLIDMAMKLSEVEGLLAHRRAALVRKN